MSSGPNISDADRVNKRTNLSLTPAARAVAKAHPGDASRFASAGLVLLGAMSDEGREALEQALAKDPERVASAVELALQAKR